MRAERLTVAVPSKGRLEEQVRAFFAESGIPLSRGAEARGYRGSLAGVGGSDVIFLQAAEIPGVLARGDAHLGITGEDLLREKVANADATIAVLDRLGFGLADLVVAVPRSWIDVRSMADLDDVSVAFHRRRGRRLRVATKYVALTRAFFAAHGVSDYRIVESLGATEGAPASGAAEIIVDITSTGATLAANNLKVLDDGTILKSQACLAASLTAPWSEAAHGALRHVLDMVAAHARARAMQVVRFRLPPETYAALAPELERVFGCAPAAADAVAPGSDNAQSFALHCPSAHLYQVVGRLRAAGCGSISAARADSIFEPVNPLYEAFCARLAS